MIASRLMDPSAEVTSRMKQPATIGVQVAVGPEADSEEVAEVTAQLRHELLDLDVDAVQSARAGTPPPGTRAVDLAALGALVVTITQADVLTAVVATVQSWVAGGQQRSVKLELDGDVLELTGVSSREQRRLADEWLRRHPLQ
jgi:hypothetical protein